MAKRHPLSKIFGTYLPILVIVLFAIGPYIWTFASSITPEAELYRPDFRFFPEHPTSENYLRLFTKLNFTRNIMDSLIVAVLTAALGLAITVPASYSFSRFRFKGRTPMLMQFLVINMFPIMLLIVPLFVMMKQIGFMDKHIALIAAYSTFTIPFSTWMLTSFFNAIPLDLDKAASDRRMLAYPGDVPGNPSGGNARYHVHWDIHLHHSLERIPLRCDSDKQ